MKERTVEDQVTGYRTQDGAGVSLVRVLGNRTADAFDPFLMLDSFDSTNPADYVAGFPMHPHRGIETISYVYRGTMVHRDSLGHAKSISDGGVQWMTAGSGILHEEMIPEADRLLGVQLWLNLPAADKMVAPAYHGIESSDIPEVALGGKSLVRVLAGSYGEARGFQSQQLPLDYYDVQLEPGASVSVPVGTDRSVMAFTLMGQAQVCGASIAEKTAVRLADGDTVTIENRGAVRTQTLLMSSRRLDEPVAWGGPIVMNTREELSDAFRELEAGTFLKEEIQG
jgi:redox-sensitive bicupin YhaK (pirin superfamily)